MCCCSAECFSQSNWHHQTSVAQVCNLASGRHTEKERWCGTPLHRQITMNQHLMLLSRWSESTRCWKSMLERSLFSPFLFLSNLGSALPEYKSQRDVFVSRANDSYGRVQCIINTAYTVSWLVSPHQLPSVSSYVSSPTDFWFIQEFVYNREGREKAAKRRWRDWLKRQRWSYVHFQGWVSRHLIWWKDQRQLLERNAHHSHPSWFLIEPSIIWPKRQIFYDRQFFISKIS